MRDARLTTPVLSPSHQAAPHLTSDTWGSEAEPQQPSPLVQSACTDARVPREPRPVLGVAPW